MINLNELLHDDDFCCTFQIVRKTTTWDSGRPVYTDTTITVEGIALPSSSKDVELIPEADRRHGLKTFYTDYDKPLNVSSTGTISDFCVWKGKRYKLISDWDYSANGFYKAVGELLGDAENEP